MCAAKAISLQVRGEKDRNQSLGLNANGVVMVHKACATRTSSVYGKIAAGDPIIFSRGAGTCETAA